MSLIKAIANVAVSYGPRGAPSSSRSVENVGVSSIFSRQTIRVFRAAGHGDKKPGAGRPIDAVSQARRDLAKAAREHTDAVVQVPHEASFTEAMFDAVLRRVEQGADPFAAARAEGVRFADLYDWCRRQAVPGSHPWGYLLEARAGWLSGAVAQAVERLADDVAQRRIRSKAIATETRAVIETMAAEARQLRQLAVDFHHSAPMLAAVKDAVRALDHARTEKERRRKKSAPAEAPRS